MKKDGLTAEDFETWIPASDALDLVTGNHGDIRAAASQLLDRLGSGLISAYAENAVGEKAGKRATELAHIVLIPTNVWKSFDAGQFAHRHEFWTTNDLTLNVPDRSGPLTVYGYAQDSVKYFSIRFDPEGVQKISPSRKPQTPQSSMPPPHAPKSSPEISKGGRPRKEFWDELWVAIFIEIYAGRLTPTKQSDIEKAMLDWASKQGHELSEPSARTRARLLFSALKKEDKN